jgi:hypothetical protein
MTEQEYLEDTIKYYSKNPKKLRCETNGVCQYGSDKPGVVGCAIGRKMRKADRIKLDNDDPSGVGIDEVLRFAAELLPAWMRKMSRRFLCDLQALHDSYRFWGDVGLSDEGYDYVKSTFKEYDLKFLKNI